MAVSFLQSAVSTTDTDTYTFSSQNLGTADSNRYIFVAASGRASGTTRVINSVTIGGVTADEAVQTQDYSDNSTVVGIYAALVPTGTTGDVVVTFNGTCVRAGIGMWSSTDPSSTTPTDTGTDIENNDGNSILTTSVSINDDPGFIIAATQAAEAITSSWTNATEQYDEATEGGGDYHSGAHFESTGAETRTITDTLSATGASALVVASFAGGAAGGGTPVSTLALLGVG